ncbi:HIRAN domain-containing protein [Paenibacillus xylanexedens]|uniref:HIRAN domain-containing protein n=1 Tax=Paenibacillus xylanexedens TaxID=528191 RepID=UPI0011A56305|nr:HIRAN domain-containing protein [Paenibacillus xylanexedens]
MKPIYNKLLVFWKGPNGENFLVGILEKKNKQYIFRYENNSLNAAKEHGFSPFIGLSDENKVYRSDKLFSVFERRTPGANRGAFKKLLEENNLSDGEDLVWDYLCLTKGRLATDSLSLIAPVVFENKSLFLDSEVAGWSYTKENNTALSKDTRLILQVDRNNENDDKAIMILNSDTKEKVGYIMKPFNYLYYYLLEKGFSLVAKIYIFDKKEGRPSFLIYCSEITKELIEGEKELQYLIEYR